MNRPIITQARGPEAKIQSDIIQFLQVREWSIMVTHGNAFQRGFPDLLALHHIHGYKWIEVKNLAAHCFTAAQKKYFPMMADAGMSIHVLVAANDSEYRKLFQPSNWRHYMYR